MQLSTIIVNHNQCRPLSQALAALKQAILHLDAEVIVVDNASDDLSLRMLRSEYPQIEVIANDKPESFSKAVNKGIEAAKGDYILIIDPSIIVGEETLEKLHGFMQLHTGTGGLSVRMLDAGGSFIEGSNKNMPPEWIKFFRFSGLSRLFSKSRLFSPHYQAGWIEEFENTETDVLNNSFMLLRKSVLKEVGVFDERFKTYGQDIDLSYRIRLSGFKNYYYAKTFVIQQGISPAAKFSWNYLKNFYGAMFTFAAKYLFRLPELRLKAMPRWSAPAYELKQ